jgi:hypothetical protein
MTRGTGGSEQRAGQPAAEMHCDEDPVLQGFDPGRGYIATVDDSLEWLSLLGDSEDTGYPEFIAEVCRGSRVVASPALATPFAGRIDAGSCLGVAGRELTPAPRNRRR